MFQADIYVLDEKIARTALESHDFVSEEAAIDRPDLSFLLEPRTAILPNPEVQSES